MLAPGEFLTKPESEKPPPDRPAAPPTEPAQPAPPAAAPESAEPRSFLLTLLRALGAIHS
jgi:hypothetical protein